jgi:hypothetical protein
MQKPLYKGKVFILFSNLKKHEIKWERMGRIGRRELTK